MGTTTSTITETETQFSTVTYTSPLTICATFCPTTSVFPSSSDFSSSFEFPSSTFATVTSPPLIVSTFFTASGETSTSGIESEGTLSTSTQEVPTISSSSTAEDTTVTDSVATSSLQEDPSGSLTVSFGSSSSVETEPSNSFTLPVITSSSVEIQPTNSSPTLSTPLEPSFSTASVLSTTIIPSISTPIFSCDPAPTNFKIGVLGEGLEQWLAEVNVPGGDTEPYFGYQQLPLVSEEFNAAVFSVENNFLKSRVLLEGNATDVYAAVRTYALGNSVVQLFPPDHLENDMFNYTVMIDTTTCQLTLSIQRGTNDITADCNGVLAFLSPQFSISRGSNCTAINLYAIPYTLPELPTLIAEPALPSATAGSCSLAQNFKIVVNVEGSEPLYLYDQIPNDDGALSLTTNSSESLVFSLTPLGQLEFSITDIWGNDVTLISEQDIQNDANEAVFFTTSDKFSSLGYQPVIATLNRDCSLSMLLPFNGARFLIICDGTIFLMLSNPGPNYPCQLVTVSIIPYIPVELLRGRY